MEYQKWWDKETLAGTTPSEEAKILQLGKEDQKRKTEEGMKREKNVLQKRRFKKAKKGQENHRKGY